MLPQRSGDEAKVAFPTGPPSAPILPPETKVITSMPHVLKGFFSSNLFKESKERQVGVKKDGDRKFPSSREEYIKIALHAVIRDCAAMEAKKFTIKPPIEQKHIIIALINSVASQYGLPREANPEAENYIKQNLKMVEQFKFVVMRQIDPVIEKLVTPFIDLISEVKTEESQADFMNKLEMLGPLDEDVNHFFGISPTDNKPYPLDRQLQPDVPSKMTSAELRNTIKMSILLRLINSGMIKASVFTEIPVHGKLNEIVHINKNDPNLSYVRRGRESIFFLDYLNGLDAKSQANLIMQMNQIFSSNISFKDACLPYIKPAVLPLLRKFFAPEFFELSETKEHGSDQKSQQKYLKELYPKALPINYSSWRDERIKRKLPYSIEAFRGKFIENQFTDKGYVVETKPSEEYIEFSAQVEKLINRLKKWCLENLPSDIERAEIIKRWDNLNRNIHNPVYISDETAITLYSQGKSLLERLAYEVERPRVQKEVAKRAMETLFKKLDVCGPGVFTALEMAYFEFSNTIAEQFQVARLTVFQQRAISYAQTFGTPPGMDIHEGNALTNAVAEEYGLPIIADEWVLRIQSKAEFGGRFEQYKRLMREEIEPIIDGITNPLVDLINAVETEEDVDYFMKRLDMFGPLNPFDPSDQDSQEFFVRIQIESKEESKKQLKPYPLDQTPNPREPAKMNSDQLRSVIRNSIYIRLINKGLIQSSAFLTVPIPEKKLTHFITLPRKLKITDRADNRLQQDAYVLCQPTCDIFWVQGDKMPSAKDFKGGSDDYAYALSNQGIYFITKKPFSAVKILGSEKAIASVRGKLKIDSVETDLSKTRCLFSSASPELLRHIEDGVLRTELQEVLFYIPKGYANGEQKAIKMNIDEAKLAQLKKEIITAEQLQGEPIQVDKLNENSLQVLQKAMGLKPGMHIIINNARLSYVQLGPKKVPFVDFFKDLDEKHQAAVLEHIYQMYELNFDFITSCLPYIKAKTINLLIVNKKIPAELLYFLIIKQGNFQALKELMKVYHSDYKGDLNIASNAELVNAVASDRVLAKLDPIPKGLALNTDLFKRFLNSRSDFSGVEFSDGMDFTELSIAEINLYGANFIKAKNLHEAKGIHAQDLTDQERVKLVKAKLSAQQILDLYKKGRRDFVGVDLRGMDLSSLNSLTDADFSRADFRGAKVPPEFFKNIKKVNAILDRISLQLLIQSNVNDFSELDLRNIDLSGLKLQGLQSIRFVKSNLSNANFNRANLRGMSFIGCDLRNAKLTNINLDNIQLVANLIGVDFTGSTGSPSLQFGDPQFAMYKSTLDPITAAKYLAMTKNRSLKDISLVGDFKANQLDLKGVYLDRNNIADLYNQGQRDFSGALLNNIDLNSLDLAGAFFNNAILTNVKFNKASLLFTSFNHAILNKVDFSNTIYQDLPPNYIKIFYGKDALNLCLTLLNQYITDRYPSYMQISLVIKSFTSSDSIESIRKKLIANKINEGEHKLLFAILKACFLIELMAKKDVVHEEDKEDKDHKLGAKEKKEDKNLGSTHSDSVWRRSAAHDILNSLFPNVPNWEHDSNQNTFAKQVHSQHAIQLQLAIQDVLTKAGSKITVTVEKKEDYNIITLHNATTENLQELESFRKQFKAIKINILS